eukprot:TRINITY_DN28939_c0_g1_i1.p1 TRINITY_DN28939_c0_g1~~TRINITY_DN28939_c0_g1_i1.p1  ORF type:complete len:148 (+),score=16.37 TRINITY_DN28939_c0_g1_i1:59-502(+)
MSESPYSYNTHSHTGTNRSYATTVGGPLRTQRQQESFMRSNLRCFPDTQRENLTAQYLEEHRRLLKVKEIEDLTYEIPFEQRYHWKQSLAIPTTEPPVRNVPHEAKTQLRSDYQNQLRYEKKMAKRLNPSDPMKPYTNRIGRKLPWG